jgi:PBP1b-binding outer membrane lipoprotein LpoB
MVKVRRALAILLLAVVAAGCVHLPPEVKAEMKPSAEPGQNNFGRDASEQTPAGNASP